ncbi:MAG: replicative DNA helicase [Caulobacter sp.]|nr:replicative DNA helicase [Caulobacter sp.]
MTGRRIDFRTPEHAAKQLPNDVEAEALVLGAVLFDNDAVDACDGLTADHFYEPTHGRVWSLVLGMIAKGERADLKTVGARLEDDAGFQELGGYGWFADLIDGAPSRSVVKDYAGIVMDRALRRDMLLFSVDLAQAASTIDPETPARTVLEDAERALFTVAEQRTDQGGFVTFGEALDGAVQMAAEAYARDGGLAGISTGLVDLDRQLGGLHPSDLLILAGRPSMGKTALATNIAFNVARKGEPVGFYSLEMSKEQLAQRILADVAEVSGDRIRKGEIKEFEFGRLREAALDLRDAPLHIDATGGLSIAKLTARARRMKRKHGLSLIVVDYLQLITTDRGREGRVQEVSYITQALKALAKDLNVPVLALSQLSRQVESRDDKRPQLSDLRESGSIEQDADAVMFVYREAYYLGRQEPREGTPEHMTWSEEMDRVRGQAEVIIGKQRHGPIGTVKLAFQEDFTRFGNLAREGRYDFARNPAGNE